MLRSLVGSEMCIRDRQGLGHDVQAVHAAHAVAVVDHQGIVILQGQGLGGTAGDDIVDDVLAALGLKIFLDLLLIDFHVVSPSADDGEIRPLDGILTVVAAAGDLELEFVWQGRTVYVVGKVVHQQAMGLELVGAGHLTAVSTDAGHGLSLIHI